MRNKTSLFKRSLAGLLTLVLVLGMIPAMSWVAKAAEGDGTTQIPAVAEDHITMPITIRDFAADGMLFEYNETSKTDTQTVVESTPTIPVYNNVTIAQNGYTALGYAYVLKWIDYHDYVDEDVNPGWHIIFVNSDGTINRVYPKGTFTSLTDEQRKIPSNGMVIYAYGGDGDNIEPCNNYPYFAEITESTKNNYSFELALVSDSSLETGYYIKCTKYKTFIPNNTKGFGMLYTNETDIYDGINEWLDVGELENSYVAWNDFTIAEGNNYIISDGGIYDGFYYGEYTHDTTVFTHYSPYKYVDIWEVDEEGNQTNYANQMLVGGTIRTNLMQKELVDGKPIYTEEAVTWIANYMKLALKISKQNSDGSYNTSYVTGDTVANGDTLANKIRQQIEQNGNRDGDYGTSYAKFFNDNGKAGDGLDHYTDIETWYDAAFFLMHNTWRDSAEDATNPGNDGYGKLAPEYHSMHLIAKTDETTGKTTYVFNSMYTDAVYNPDTGEIYNTQIEDYEHAVNNNNFAYADGNPQPVDRFDPLGKYGTGLFGRTGQYLGYGIASPDTYGDMIEPSTDNWCDYYDETNYHLSLEGHAQFVYQYDANQYFTFTGDDDVYLYINGVRVLDIGGGHSIAKVTINVNDVAKRIGLENGKTYSFDFFYMERHGTAANFGIETNIQIADASMHTTKQGFQNGVNTGYGGPVNANNHVGYTFEIQNDGSANIYNLSFNDPTIGVYVGWDDIRLNQANQTKDDGTPLYTLEDDIYLIYWDDDGTMHYFEPGHFTAQELMDRLKQGLAPGERLGVYGFKYKIKPNQWHDADKDGTNEFINTVYTSANSQSNGTGTPLQGVADWKVVEMKHPYEAFRVYDWVHKAVSNDPADAATLTWKAPGDNGIPASNTVTVSKEELINRYLLNGENNLTLTDAEKAAVNIVLCTAAGNKDPYYINPNVKKDAESGGITYTSKTTGKDTVFFVFEGLSNKVYDSLVFSYEVYTYGAVDNVYVLDYGLSVELAGNNFGFHTNDHLQLNENNRQMTAVVTGMVDADGNDITAQAGTYGDFAYTTSVNAEGKTIPSLKYTPDAIINGTDEVYAKFRVMEKAELDAGKDPTIFNSVEMVQKITTAPANVVYYEENFPGITYVEEGDNKWVQYETWVGDEKVTGTEQSADQDSNYGSDPNYEADKNGTLKPEGEVTNSTTFNLDTSDLNAYQKNAISFLNEYLGLGGADSNGTVKELVVTETAEVMSFEFEGTGFEIVSRTTNDVYAVINVQVYKKNAEGPDTFVTQKPVITESKGGTLYQVPIISITGLDRDNYKVVVKAANSGNVNRILYIDGIRIYGALRDNTALEYYNPEEYRAEFFEVKQLIQDGHIIYADYSATAVEDGTSEYPEIDPMLVTGTTLVENISGVGGVLDTIGDDEGETVDDYLAIGPNNELYLDGYTTNGLIAFFLTPKADYPEGARTIEIGAHRKADSYYEENGPVYMAYGSSADQFINAAEGDPNFYTVSSGTEMYYTIDISEWEPDANGRYLVMIGIKGGEDFFGATLALTNLKIAGYDISFAETAILNADAEDTLDTLSIVQETFTVLRTRLAAMEQEPEVEQARVNENLSITSASLKASQVVSGKSNVLTVQAGADAQTIVVTDAFGNVVEPTKCICKVSGGTATFSFAWTITGIRGQALNYTIRVYDANDLASVNTETVTVTIK